MSTSPKSSKIMTSACSVRLWPHSHLNMDLSVYTPTWHRVLLSGKNSGFLNPTESHPVLCWFKSQIFVQEVIRSWSLDFILSKFLCRTLPQTAKSLSNPARPRCTLRGPAKIWSNYPHTNMRNRHKPI